jgi:hypothetical protein
VVCFDGAYEQLCLTVLMNLLTALLGCMQVVLTFSKLLNRRSSSSNNNNSNNNNKTSTSSPL